MKRATGKLKAVWKSGKNGWVLQECDSGMFMGVGFFKDDAAHLVDCWNAIESIGGDPETVGEMQELIFDLFANLSENAPHTVIDRAKYIMIKTSSIEGKEAILSKTQ